MSTYALDEVLRQWSQGIFTSEQTNGHILQHLVLLQEQVKHLRGRLAALEGVTPTPPSAGNTRPRQ
jgi:hypothetical protein